MNDPLHEPINDGVRWTTRNVGEAIPGVPTPLTWSLWYDAINHGSREMYGRLGLYSPEELAEQVRENLVTISISHGQPIAFIDIFSIGISRVPGMSPARFEHDYFGIESDAATPRPQPRGWGRVLVKAPATVIAFGRELHAELDANRKWWDTLQNKVIAPSDAPAVVKEGIERFRRTIYLQILQSAITQGLYGAVAALAAKSGNPGLEGNVMGGAPDLEEALIADALWALGHGRLDIAAFVARFGYHGPDVGELDNRSWREAPDLIAGAATMHSGKGDDESPAARRRERRLQGDDAVRLIHSGLNPVLRKAFDTLLKAASRGEQRREAAKAGFLQILDVIRMAIRSIAADMVGRGLLESPDDIVYLTLDEILHDQLPANIKGTIAFRRNKREEHRRAELPGTGVGEPVAGISVRPDLAGVGDVLVGVPAASGAVTGTARVVTDAAECLEPLGSDEILIAHATDPGWVALFMGAGALVVDVGGPLSHAAIIARSLGIPCVINTIDGTRRIPEGAQISVDGATGQITVLSAGTIERVASSEPVVAHPTEVQDGSADCGPEMLAVLHCTLVTGVASDEMLSTRTGVESGPLSELLSDGAAKGLIKARKGRKPGWVITPAGRQAHGSLMAQELARSGAESDLETAYTAFLELNQPFKELCTSWQLRPGPGGESVINDHSDQEYDAAVIRELGNFHVRAAAMAVLLPSAIPHFSDYGARLEEAWNRVSGGETAAFANPLADSYHDVWMELHQDLMATLGRERSSADGH